MGCTYRDCRMAEECSRFDAKHVTQPRIRWFVPIDGMGYYMVAPERPEAPHGNCSSFDDCLSFSPKADEAGRRA